MKRIPHLWLLVTPALLFAGGFLLNAIVIALNGGQMPVLMAACVPDPDDLLHGCMTHATHLKVLADWITIPGRGIASPGDFLMWAAAGTWDYALVAWFALILLGGTNGTFRHTQLDRLTRHAVPNSGWGWVQRLSGRGARHSRSNAAKCRSHRRHHVRG